MLSNTSSKYAWSENNSQQLEHSQHHIYIRIDTVKVGNSSQSCTFQFYKYSYSEIDLAPEYSCERNTRDRKQSVKFSYSFETSQSNFSMRFLEYIRKEDLHITVYSLSKIYLGTAFIPLSPILKSTDWCSILSTTNPVEGSRDETVDHLVKGHDNHPSVQLKLAYVENSNLSLVACLQKQ
jgi:hypothetical protein